jgi:hypothetical protein
MFKGIDMTFTHYTKCIAKLLCCVLLFFIPFQKVEAVAYVPTFLDKEKEALLTAINLELGLTLASLKKANASIDSAGNAFKKAKPEIVNTFNTLKKYDTLFSEWEPKTDPSTLASAEYVTNVTAAENALKSLTASDKLNLDKLEKDNFDNPDAFTNSALQYSQGNDKHKTVFDGGLLCPGKPDKPKNYSTLQYKACTIINNATAYKIKLSESAQKKQTVIDDAIVDILKKSPTTMGNFEARRVALSDLQALQKNVIDEYDLKAKNADLQIKIAEEARRYASEAMLVGPTKQVARGLVVEAFKAAIGIAANQYFPATIPYNE